MKITVLELPLSEIPKKKLSDYPFFRDFLRLTIQQSSSCRFAL